MLYNNLLSLLLFRQHLQLHDSCWYEGKLPITHSYQGGIDNCSLAATLSIPKMKRHGNELICLAFSVVDCVYKHVHTQNYYVKPCLVAINKDFVAHTGNMSLRGVVPYHH